jgi:hypothetical protein
MASTVTQLITNAYYASGIVSREFQTVQGYQLNDGLGFLNDIIGDKVVEDDMIQYYTTGYPITAIIGQEEYYIPNLIEAETIVFFIDGPPNEVRYSMRKNYRKQYFGSPRAQNIKSLPFNWHMEKCFGGTNLFLYYLPDQAYAFQIVGKFRLSEVLLNQNLSAPITTVDLGLVTIGGTGNFGIGQLIVNGVDLAGTYATQQALAAYINTGVIPNVIARIVNNEFILYNNVNAFIIISSNGSQIAPNYVTFSNFSTLNGQINQTFVPMQLDRFYISYLKYALADRLCSEFNYEVPQGVAKQLGIYQNYISKKSATMDLHSEIISTLNRRSESFNYGQANLGHGWTVP